MEGTLDNITGAFTFHEIMLASEIDGCEKFNAYSTKINVYAANAEVNITSCTTNKKLAFYSDGTYHKTARFETKSDALGYVTIVQEADSLAPDCFNVHFKEDMLQINPAEQAQKTLLGMTSQKDFKDAMIFTPQGQKLPLVETTDQNKLSGAAAGICSIRNSIHSLMPGFISPISQFMDGVVFRIVDKVISILPASLTDNPFVGFISEIIEDVAGALNWLIGKVKELYDKTIGKAIEFIIQKTEKVWEAVKNVLELVGIPIGKIFDFLKKALGIDDACRINNALKNMAHMSVNVLKEKTKEISKKSIEAIDSPMDTTSDNAYNEKCAVPQSACSVYTYLWWAKTATSSLSSLTGIWGEKMFHSSAEYVKKGIDIIYLAECFISGFAELFAFIEASAITKSVDGEYKKDGGCFISDSLGFAFDDIKSILDFCIGQAKNASTPLIVSRETFCALYVISQISTGAVILANK